MFAEFLNYTFLCSLLVFPTYPFVATLLLLQHLFCRSIMIIFHTI